MGVRILADTNCVSDFLNAKLTNAAVQFINNASVEISVINRMELLSWTGANAEQMNIISEFIETCTVHAMDEPIIIAAIDIRRKHKLELPDAIIAATAVVKNISLLTHNEIDFQNIKGLKITDQHTL